tara:strand:- start:274 stop:549 length:276 start_codon:yes stop_codon:yes gene_type:complete
VINRDELLALAHRLDADDQDDTADPFLKHVTTDDGGILIEGNDAGLKHLVSQILGLLARDFFPGRHQDFDTGAPSDEGSCRMTIVRKGTGN